MRYRLLFLALALALALPERLAAETHRGEPLPVPTKTTGKIANTVVGETCRRALRTCLKSCSALGDDKQGCTMDCETDCSVCTFEETGTVNPAHCK